MLTQKIVNTGEDITVKIPKKYLKDDSLVVLEKNGKEVIISSKKKSLAPNIDPKFIKRVDEFIEQHRDVLEELADR